MKYAGILGIICLMTIFASSCAKICWYPECEVVIPVPEVKKVEEKAPEELVAKEIEEVRIKEEELAREIAAFEAEDIHFDFDKYNIRPDAAEILRRKTEWLKAHPNVRVLIETYCDERGTEGYNRALGERRANSVKQFLLNAGIDVTCMSTISYGEERPIDPGHNEEAWAKNRRAHFVITDY
jgi:peptidoglycan-associated lipoprotein